MRVEQLEKEISEAAAAGRLRVTLLTGPGGEGKSTMLHQLAVDLTEKYRGVHVVRHESRYAPLTKELLQRLLATPGSFVIASDDAEHIARDVYDAVGFLRGQPRRNIQFLLACRRTDWEWARARSRDEQDKFSEQERPASRHRVGAIYRLNEEGEKAVQTFRKRYSLVFNSGKLNKGFFTEWAAAEGHVQNHCIDAWLVGIALSDKLGDKHDGDSAPMILLSGLTSALEALYHKTADECDDIFHDESSADTFLKAVAAASQLGLDERAQEGLRENYDTDTSIMYLQKGAELGMKKHVPKVETVEAINRLIAGVRLAWELNRNDERRWQFVDKDWERARKKLPAADRLRFEALRRFFGAESETGKRPLIVKPPSRRPR